MVFRCVPATWAAAAARTGAVVGPAVTNIQKPGSLMRAPCGISRVVSSSTMASTPTPTVGRG